MEHDIELKFDHKDDYDHFSFDTKVELDAFMGGVCAMSGGTDQFKVKRDSREEHFDEAKSLVDQAIILSKQIHFEDTYDKAGDYFERHLEVVAQMIQALIVKGGPFSCQATLPTHVMIAAAYMHDAMEDHPELVTYRFLCDSFKDQAVADLVRTLTRQKGDEYTEYIQRIGCDRNASLIKLADLGANMEAGENKKITNSYERARLDKYKIASLYLMQILEVRKGDICSCIKG